MQELMRCSVKQLKMAFECPRKWAYHYLFGVEQLEGPTLAEGNAVHHQIDCYLKGKTPPYTPETSFAKMARALIKYAEPRSPEAQSEVKQLVELPEYGIKVDLRCDFLDPWYFKDWKTTGASGPKAKLPNGEYWTLQTLENDWQARIYAFLLMHKVWRGVTEVGAEWCYVCKKFDPGQEPKTWSVGGVFQYIETKEWFDTYVPPVVQLIKDLRASHLKDARLVPHNAKSCEFSGRWCDAAGHCRFISSPVMTYEELHLPVLKG